MLKEHILIPIGEHKEVDFILKIEHFSIDILNFTDKVKLNNCFLDLKAMEICYVSSIKT